MFRIILNFGVIRCCFCSVYAVFTLLMVYQSTWKSKDRGEVAA